MQQLLEHMELGTKSRVLAKAGKSKQLDWVGAALRGTHTRALADPARTLPAVVLY